MKDFLKFIFFGISKGPGVEVINPKTGSIKILRMGFSWQLFLLSSLFGITLFLKGLWKWGLLMFASSCLDFWFRYQQMLEAYQFQELSFPNSSKYFMAFNIFVSLFFGLYGNKMAGVRALKKGARFLDPKSPMTLRAIKEWRLSKHYLKPVKVETL